MLEFELSDRQIDKHRYRWQIFFMYAGKASHHSYKIYVYINSFVLNTIKQKNNVQS